MTVRTTAEGTHDGKEPDLAVAGPKRQKNSHLCYSRQRRSVNELYRKVLRLPCAPRNTATTPITEAKSLIKTRSHALPLPTSAPVDQYYHDLRAAHHGDDSYNRCEASYKDAQPRPSPYTSAPLWTTISTHEPPHQDHPPPPYKPLRIEIQGPLETIQKLLPGVAWHPLKPFPQPAGQTLASLTPGVVWR
jgi:hypothetical protein